MGASGASRDRRAPGRRGLSLRVLVAGALAVGLALTSAGCSGDGGAGGSAWQVGQDGQSSQPEPPPKASAAISLPAADAKDVPTTTGIEFTTTAAVDSTVELKDAAGTVVQGKLSSDGKRWVPEDSLEFGRTYTVTVTATGDDGRPATATSTFTTMARPTKLVRVSSFLGDGQVVGVGMPLIVEFSRAVPQDLRDDVQRRMSVRTTPEQEGAWRWISPTVVHYRPRSFWKAGTAVEYRIRAGGLPMGDGWYGRNDLSVALKIGSALVMSVDNKTKQMTVTRDGQLVRKIPVSLGKKTTPSSSGTMLVMEKFKKTVFDTRAELGPKEGYRLEIDFAQRLTYGGEFIHSAPWSEGKQGRENVSHGCVNVSMKDGEWLFGQTKLGDPVTVKGTERPLRGGNGWTDWSLSWDEWVKGSAVPVG